MQNPVHHKPQPDNSSNTNPAQWERTAGRHAGQTAGRFSRREGRKTDREVEGFEKRRAEKEKSQRSGEGNDAKDDKEMCVSVCNWGEERQNNIPRHVRIKKLSAKAKINNNVPLVDRRQESVSNQHVLVSPSAPGRNRSRTRGPAGLHGAAWRAFFFWESCGGRGERDGGGGGQRN